MRKKNSIINMIVGLVGQLLNMLLSDLKNTLFKARFQVLPPQSEEMAAKLKKLDERLYSPTPTFAQLEDDALCLCEFFVKVSSPSTPIPDVERYLQEKHPHEYVRLIWADELSALLESVQKECEERVTVLVREMAEAEGVDEKMKENEQMEWVRRMEMICGRVEEVVCEEIIG
jgi:hypothetical protein